jgi:integrase
MNTPLIDFGLSVSDLKQIGRTMPRKRRQNGWVEITGKTRKSWTGYWYEYKIVDGVERRMEKSRVLGLKSDMTKTEAKAKLREVIQNFRPQADSPFSTAAESYFRLNECHWSRKNIGVLRSVFKTHINPAIGSIKISEITKTDIDKFLAKLAHDGRSHSLIKKCLTHVRATLEQAVEDGLLPYNRSRKCKMPTKLKTVSQRFLDMDEIRSLLSVCGPRDSLIMRIFLVCALRPSELFALRSDDVQNEKLRIDEAVVLGSVKGTKTDESNNWVPLPPALEMEIRAYIQSERITKPKEFLFPSEVGTPMSQDNYLDRNLKVLGAKAGIPDLNFQVLRRTCATHFQKYGRVKDAQALLRHRDASVTLRHYQKTLNESLISAVGRWEAAVSGEEMVQ